MFLCIMVVTVVLSFASNAFHYSMTHNATGWADIWMSEVESTTGQNVSARCKNPSGKGLMESAISKMMGKPKPRAESESEAPPPANGAPAQPPRSRVVQAAGAASPARERSPSAASAQAAASPAKERRGSAASAQAAASPAKERAQAAAGPAAATASPGRRRAPSGDAGAE